MSLDTWLATGRKVMMGGKDWYIMPLPLGRLRDIANYLQEQVHEELETLLQKQAEHPDPVNFLITIFEKIDAVDMVYHLLYDPENPDTGEPINKALTVKFVDKYLDAPTIRRLMAKFVEVNELDELLKNLQSLPWLSQIWEVITMTFGISVSSYLLRSTDSNPGRQEDSPSHKSMLTSEPTTEESKSNTEKEEPQNPPETIH